MAHREIRVGQGMLRLRVHPCLFLDRVCPKSLLLAMLVSRSTCCGPSTLWSTCALPQASPARTRCTR
jgi:hypothetical protein